MAAWDQVSADQLARWARYGTEETTILTFEVRGGATAECRALGYRRATGVEWRYVESGGAPLTQTRVVVNTSPYVYRSNRYLVYTAVCRGRYTPPSGGKGRLPAGNLFAALSRGTGGGRLFVGHYPAIILPGNGGPHRPSRVSGNPAAGRQRAGLLSTVRDSRLRGNDGRGDGKDG